MVLETIREPEDLRKLNTDQLGVLCSEIRRELIHTVARTGGHLASNLGVVELTVALHRVFDFRKDRIIFDVGHQSYVHKMITGRLKQFETLRQYGGISGFPRRDESPYDCFETGHASTSISAALGMARARDFLKEDYATIAFVGDGALTGGMCYEALNDAGNAGTRMIVILNDNEMSIAKNVGALSSSLTNLRVSSEWQNAKLAVRRFRRIRRISIVLAIFAAIGLICYFFILKRTYRNYKIIRTSEQEDIVSTHYVEMDGKILRYSPDGVSLVTDKLDTVWS